jgi:hypothetical protein
MCHQDGPVSRHGTPKEFREKYGTDTELLEMVDKQLKQVQP